MARAWVDTRHMFRVMCTCTGIYGSNYRVRALRIDLSSRCEQNYSNCQFVYHLTVTEVEMFSLQSSHPALQTD